MTQKARARFFVSTIADELDQDKCSEALDELEEFVAVNQNDGEFDEQTWTKLRDAVNLFKAARDAMGEAYVLCSEA